MSLIFLYRCPNRTRVCHMLAVHSFFTGRGTTPIGWLP